jgi:serine phosphatase RsbU (regulator of sigma subunit)
MMFARTLMRAAAFSGREPAEALARTNELMLADSRSEMFVTAYYSTLDAERHLLTYASAGHNLAIYAPANGCAPGALITEGIPLGILAPVQIEQKMLSLLPGDVVLFYTDGVSEALNSEDKEFGTERLAEILRAHRAESAQSIADAIEAAVHEFTGDLALFDDFTLVLIRRDAASAQVLTVENPCPYP